MFAKKDSASIGIDTIIAKDVVFKGDFVSQGSVRVDGQIEGTINVAGDIIIGESGKLNGTVKANNSILAGIMEGSLIILGHLTITATGKMHGDITCKLLTIDEGGQLEGSSCMSSRGEAIATEKPRLASKANIAGAGKKQE